MTDTTETELCRPPPGATMPPSGLPVLAARLRGPLPTGAPEVLKTQPPDPVVVKVVEAAGLRNACDLDLLLFFSRHPRVVLSSEQLATYVGYDLGDVARALDLLLGAGLLKRTVNHGAPGRMYVLEVDRAEEWLEPLRLMCATPDGRHALKAWLRERRPSKNGSHHA